MGDFFGNLTAKSAGGTGFASVFTTLNTPTGLSLLKFVNDTFSSANAGLSPMFKIPNGPVIGVDVGLIMFDVTFDEATGDFVSFSVVRVAGQRPTLDSQICAALT